MLKFFKLSTLFVVLLCSTINRLQSQPAPIRETCAAGLGIGGVALSSRLVYATYNVKQYGFRGMAPRAFVAVGSVALTVKLLKYGFKEESFPRFMASKVL